MTTQTVFDAATEDISITWKEPGDIGGIPVATIECIEIDTLTYSAMARTLIFAMRAAASFPW